MAAVSIRNSTLFADANLVSLWELDGNSNDSKGSNNGTDTSVTYNAGNGKFVQGAGYASASTSRTVINDAASLKQTGNFTLMGWVKTTTTVSSQQHFFQSFSANTNLAGVLMGYTSTGKIFALSGRNTGTVINTDYKELDSATGFDDSNWHYFAATWDGSTFSLYLDGAAPITSAWANAPGYAATNYVRIGCGNDTGSNFNYFNGAIDDVALFSRALSSTEISNHYSGADALPSGGMFMFFNA